MSGWSLSLRVPQPERTEQTVRAYVAYAESKRAAYCNDDQDVALDHHRKSALDRLEDGQFFVNVPVDPAFADRIEWDAVADLTENWVVSGPALDELIDLLRTAATELDDGAGDPPTDYRCYAEAVPIALCEFARDRGYAVEVYD